MNPQRVSIITLGVTDIARAKKFYGDLGWTPKDEVEGQVVFYQLHASVLGLFGLNALADDQSRPDAKLGTGAITLAQNFPDEAGVDAAHAKALSVGATNLKSPEKTFWGGYAGYYADPDGHPWEVAFNPFWKLSDDGEMMIPDPDA